MNKEVVSSWILNVSQVVLAYILTESQLAGYAKRISKGADGFPDDALEVLPAFDFNAPPRIALQVMRRGVLLCAGWSGAFDT